MPCASRFVLLAMTHQTFFEQAVLQRGLGDDFLLLGVLGSISISCTIFGSAVFGPQPSEELPAV
jgi:hypothetical protein